MRRRKQSIDISAIRLDVQRYQRADWAPRAPGVTLKWAWRATSPSGNTVAGACGGPRAHALHQAQHAAERLAASFWIDPRKYSQMVQNTMIRRAQSQRGGQ